MTLDIVMKALGIVFLVIVVICVGYGGWLLKRKINYTFQYRDLVQETVREMVKPECLDVKVEEVE